MRIADREHRLAAAVADGEHAVEQLGMSSDRIEDRVAVVRLVTELRGRRHQGEPCRFANRERPQHETIDEGKIAVFAPIPRPRERTATKVTIGVARGERTASRKSRSNAASEADCRHLNSLRQRQIHQLCQIPMAGTWGTARQMPKTHLAEHPEELGSLPVARFRCAASAGPLGCGAGLR